MDPSINPLNLNEEQPNSKNSIDKDNSMSDTFNEDQIMDDTAITDDFLFANEPSTNKNATSNIDPIRNNHSSSFNETTEIQQNSSTLYGHQSLNSNESVDKDIFKRKLSNLNLTNSDDSNSIQFVNEIHRNNASPISKRLRQRSPKYIEDAYDSDYQLSPLPKHTKKNMKSKKTVKVPNKTKKANQKVPNNYQHKPSTSQLSTNNDFLDLYLENEDSMDDQLLITNLRLQLKRTKLENLNLREQNADLVDENERIRTQLTHLERQNIQNKGEIFNIQVENHKLNKQNTELKQKNSDLLRDNTSKTRIQEITKEELIRVRTDKILKSNDSKIFTLPPVTQKTPTPEASAPKTQVKRVIPPITPAQGYRFSTYKPLDWTFINKKKQETTESQPSTSVEDKEGPNIVNIE